MNIPYVFRKCSKCGEWLVANKINFWKRKSGKYGLTSRCKQCHKEYINKVYIKQWREQNKKRINERNKQWRELNKEYYKQWRQTNKEYIREYKKQYSKEKKAESDKKYRQSPQGQTIQLNAYNARRLKEKSQGKGITSEQWLEMMEFFDWKCAYSGKYIGGKSEHRTIDHINPISKGGQHEIWNTVPMYDSYNYSKKNKEFLEWYKEQTFFSEERLNKIYEWQEYAYKKWHDKEEII